MSRLALVLLCACAARPEVAPANPGAVEATGEVITTVNGQPITQPMVDAMLRQMPPEQVQAVLESGQLPALIHQLEVAEVLYQRAIASELHTDPEVQLDLAMVTRNTLASTFVDRHVSAAVTQADIEAAYAAAPERFAQEQVRASHILTADAESMAVVTEALAAGGDFAELAREHSKDPGSGAQGGDLGWFGRGRMVEAFEEAAFAAEEGVPTEPFETRFGQHIVLVTGTRSALPLEQVQDELRQELESQAVDALLTEVEAELAQP